MSNARGLDFSSLPFKKIGKAHTGKTERQSTNQVMAQPRHPGEPLPRYQVIELTSSMLWETDKKRLIQGFTCGLRAELVSSLSPSWQVRGKSKKTNPKCQVNKQVQESSCQGRGQLSCHSQVTHVRLTPQGKVAIPNKGGHGTQTNGKQTSAQLPSLNGFCCVRMGAQDAKTDLIEYVTP